MRLAIRFGLIGLAAAGWSCSKPPEALTQEWPTPVPAPLTTEVKPPVQGTPVQIVEAAPPAPKEPVEVRNEPKDEYNTAFEKWKTRAVQEFPELSIAGSPLNTEFVARAKRMQESKAEDLNLPNWPYLLALQVSAEISNREKQTTAPRATAPVVVATSGSIERTVTRTTPPISQYQPRVQSGPHSVDALMAMSELPKGGAVRGTITSLSRSLNDPMGVNLTLDKMLNCEVNLNRAASVASPYPSPVGLPYENATRSQALELVWQGDVVKLVNKSTVSYAGNKDKSTNVLATYGVGQTVTVEGVLTKKVSGKIDLKGVLKKDFQ